MKFSPIYFSLILLLIVIDLSAQNKRGDLRIVFYNTENLFDTFDEAETADEEFLPEGSRHWNNYKFYKKLNSTAKVLLAAGGWQPAGIIGLCEVENRFVMEQLTGKTPLKNAGYKIIHKESPDSRGIDISMLYLEDKFRPLLYNYIPLKDKNGEVLKTREILYVEGIVNNGDTLHVFFNHWPSRYGGYLETVELRGLAASTLRNEIERIFQRNENSNIIIMGDFNDQPDDESIRGTLQAIPYKSGVESKALINLSAAYVNGNIGTIKYQSQWLVYDQVIVSGFLFNEKNSLSCSPEGASVFFEKFLLTDDKTYGGKKPFRTFSGFQYTGGFSDHLPVFLDLNFR